jgi:hypothetical protein
VWSGTAAWEVIVGSLDERVKVHRVGEVLGQQADQQDRDQDDGESGKRTHRRLLSDPACCFCGAPPDAGWSGTAAL